MSLRTRIDIHAGRLEEHHIVSWKIFDSEEGEIHFISLKKRNMTFKNTMMVI